MTRNQIEYLALRETRRANQAREAETHRSNTANEALTKKRDLEVQRSNLVREGLSSDTLVETQRSNLAREVEANRSNVAKETETNRSNLAKELEENRSNVARESETARHNTMSENIEAFKAGASAVVGPGKVLGGIAGLGVKVGMDALYQASQNITPKSNAQVAADRISKFGGSDKRSPIQKQMDAIISAQKSGRGIPSDADPLGIIP